MWQPKKKNIDIDKLCDAKKITKKKTCQVIIKRNQ
jgi:hypothetical protein